MVLVLALTEQQKRKMIAMDIFGHQQFVYGLRVWSLYVCMSWSVCFALQLLFQRALELHLFFSMASDGMDMDMYVQHLI